MKNKIIWIVLCAALLVAALLLWQPWNGDGKDQQTEAAEQAEQEETPAQETQKEEPVQDAAAAAENPGETETEGSDDIEVDDGEEGAFEEAEGDGFAGF